MMHTLVIALSDSWTDDHTEYCQDMMGDHGCDWEVYEDEDGNQAAVIKCADILAIAQAAWALVCIDQGCYTDDPGVA